MHERSIAKNMLNLILEKTKSLKKEKTIKKINIIVGEFTMIQEELLVRAFYDLAKSTIAEKAEIKIINNPLTGKCLSCKKEFLLNKKEFICPFCKSSMIQIISGDELLIEDIEISK
ncbi:MAG: hydrogenase maturation nickel metallochaperone HypA [Atribacterota bacterium]|nr:hydrogenase maturation nickel metallochaperone HypA [Atribacterota bacterium]